MSRSHMPNCKEVARLISSDELADASWPDRALVRLHLALCRHCKGYEAQLGAIGAAVRGRSNSGLTDSASFETLQSAILERCREAADTDIEDGRGRDPEPPADPQ